MSADSFITISVRIRTARAPPLLNYPIRNANVESAITLADHHTYDLSGFYIVATGNIGSHHLLRQTRLPFTTLERAVISELHRSFRPELIGRFDEIVVFKPLTTETQRDIADLVIAEETARLKSMGIELSVAESAIEFLIRRGTHKTLGARPMRRTVQKHLADAVRAALKQGVNPSGVVQLNVGADGLAITHQRISQHFSANIGPQRQDSQIGSKAICISPILQSDDGPSDGEIPEKGVVCSSGLVRPISTRKEAEQR